jgi:hypothetical protein
MAEVVSTDCCGWDGDHLSAAKGDGGRAVAPLRRQPGWPDAFPGAAVPSFHTAGRRLPLADVAAMDAVEGRLPFVRKHAGRG